MGLHRPMRAFKRSLGKIHIGTQTRTGRKKEKDRGLFNVLRTWSKAEENPMNQFWDRFWDLTIRCTLYVLSLPFLAIIYGPSWLRRFWVYLKMQRNQYNCTNCQEHVDMIGMWKCKCGYTYLGHAFTTCANCGKDPGYVPCGNCGVSVKNPM